MREVCQVVGGSMQRLAVSLGMSAWCSDNILMPAGVGSDAQISWRQRCLPCVEALSPSLFIAQYWA